MQKAESRKTEPNHFRQSDSVGDSFNKCCGVSIWNAPIKNYLACCPIESGGNVWMANSHQMATGTSTREGPRRKESSDYRSRGFRARSCGCSGKRREPQASWVS